MIRFSKMHGLGNDFMVLETLSQRVPLVPENIRAWADRHTGVGFDQLLVISASTHSAADFNYRIFNADGQEVEQCGNGARCVAVFVKQHAWQQTDSLCFNTVKGLIHTTVLGDGRVAVDMGLPVFAPAQIPFVVSEQAPYYTVCLDHTALTCAVLSMGNPHCVLFVDALDEVDVAGIGAALACHPQFPQGVNVNFVEINSTYQLRSRVYERGVGETRACGSGACASVVAGRLLQGLAATVSVVLPGGSLQVMWQGMGHSVQLTGAATLVFTGEISE